MKTISLVFDGYWREINKAGIPEKSGIYGVYACTYNSIDKFVSLRELIYIGESENVNNRLEKHERLSDWKKRLRSGETLCYSFAPVDYEDRIRSEAAVIFYHEPPCNDEYSGSFPFPDTTINTSGKNHDLHSSFSIKGYQ